MHLSLILLQLCTFYLVLAQEEYHKVEEEPDEDPCENVKCKLGEICKEGKCNCMDSCPSEWNSYNRQLCVDGVTYRHECDLWRNQCYCRSGDTRCGSDQFSSHRANENSAIKYYDECRDLSGLCDWDQNESTFSLRLGMWFQELLRQKWSSASWSIDDDSLLRPMDAKARSTTSKLVSQSSSHERVNGAVISYWFCELDRRNRGEFIQKKKLRQNFSYSTVSMSNRNKTDNSV
ncbi:SPARC isoform 2 [Schistosoma japonicum]|uniref:SPARC isoform 2 n=1 Tax=Schistosoma japonicum TaxID=6182 RepID=A0A4Z2DPN7_SCHJA|nr:SPARC isoform 2 [Schistosoma japonicum]